MRQGMDLAQLANELEFQQDNKRDFLVNTTAMKVITNELDGPLGIWFKSPGEKPFEYEMSQHMLTQVSAHTKVPMNLIELMRKGSLRERDALSKLISTRLQEHEAIRMIRTLGRLFEGDYARAFLSDRYRPLDNYDLAQSVLATIGGLKHVKMVSSDVTETRLYLKFANSEMKESMGQETHPITKKVVGDIVEAGVVVSNSEVGAGSLSIEPFLYRLVCLNGMIVNEASLRKAHLGRTHGNDSTNADAWELYTDRTRALDDAALFSKVQDVISAMLVDEKLFKGIVTRFASTRERPITGDMQAVVTEITKRYAMTVDEGQGVLKHLAKGGDLSQFGMVNAVTRFAGVSKKMSYDRATELESVGGRIMELPNIDWKHLAGAKLTQNGGKDVKKKSS